MLEILSTDSTVEVELPAWCRMTQNDMVSWTKLGNQRSFVICKGPLSERSRKAAAAPARPIGEQLRVAVTIPDSLPRPVAVPAIAPLSVMGIGSWPRPRWMLQAMHERLENRLDDGEFHATADDAVRLNVEAQLRAGVDVLTDGEQRRDSYASFAGGLARQLPTHPVERSRSNCRRSRKVRDGASRLSMYPLPTCGIRWCTASSDGAGRWRSTKWNSSKPVRTGP